MPKIHGEYAGNRLLDSLATKDLDALSQHLEWVDLTAGTILNNGDLGGRFIYFPVSGLCSVLSGTADREQLEAGLVGSEGAVGLAIYLYAKDSSFDVVARTAVRSLRISDGRFLEVYNSRVSVRNMMLRYAYAFLVQVLQTTVTTAKMTIEQRLARWLLMCEDRLDLPNIPLTHKILSELLGVRRAGITVAMQSIESTAAIKATRGHVRIMNRPELRRIAGPGYGRAEAEYRKVMRFKRKNTLSRPKS